MTTRGVTIMRYINLHFTYLLTSRPTKMCLILLTCDKLQNHCYLSLQKLQNP